MPSAKVALAITVAALPVIPAPKAPAVLEPEPAVALGALAREGALSVDAAKQLVESHHLMRQVENMAAVTVGNVFDPKTAPDGVKWALARAAGIADFDELEALLEQAAGCVRSAIDGCV